MLSNLFASASPFQIDGNFGTSSAIAEMLLQSGDNEISLIPAIPAKWKAEGSFRGLKARGGFTVDCGWKNARVTAYHIYSKKQSRLWIRFNGERKEITSEKI